VAHTALKSREPGLIFMTSFLILGLRWPCSDTCAVSQ
jgi:hypothetical protein